MKHEAVTRQSRKDEPFAKAIARARASYSAGGGVEHRVVTQWLLTWGEPGRVTFEEWLAAWDG